MVTNVRSQWVGGDLYFLDKNGNTIFYIDGTNRALNIPAGSTLTLGENATGPIEVAADDGAISAVWGNVVITKASAAALTIADPTADDDDGNVLRIVSTTAYAHTVDNSAGSGFNGAGSGSDVATFGGAAGDSLSLLAYQGKWYVLPSTNVSLG